MNDNTTKVKKPKKLIKDVSRSLKAIRKNYKIALRKNSKTKAEEWLCDNYYIFNREGNLVLKDLKMSKNQPLSKDSFTKMYEVCDNLCCKSLLPDQEILEDKMTQLKPTVPELELLPVMLRAVLINSLANLSSLQNEDETELLSTAVKSLRLIPDLDFESIVENVSEVEKMLVQDPTGDYPKMDDKTKARYRHCIAQQALDQKISETQFTRQILVQAKNEQVHIGKFLTLNKDNKKRGIVLITLEILLPLISCIGLGLLIKNWYVPILLYLPFKEIFLPILNYLFMINVKPRFMPKYKIENIDTEQNQTLVVISLLLPTEDKVKKLKKRLIELKRSNGNLNTKFCVLTDYKSSKSPTTPNDKDNKNAMKQMIDELNNEYGGFIFALRPRTYSKTQNEFTGWERKRGAIIQLIRALKGIDEQFEELYGDIDSLQNTKYIMALDADTNLPFDTVDELVSVAVHPLNKPVVDGLKGRVVSGYGILAPKIETEIDSAYLTGFSRIMSGIGGITAYVDACSDKYQDLFDEAIFAGKGLIDIEVFYKLLEGKFKPEVVLSHDILEGGYLRVGFVSDVEVTDSFPARENSFFDRLHRWVRGDWQNLRYVFGKKPENSLNGVSRYKLIDNMRRSITPVISVLAILLSLLMPYRESIIVTAIVVISTIFPHIFAGLYSLIVGGVSRISRLYYSNAMPSALKSFVGGGVELIMLAQNAWVCFDAIVKSLWRQVISHKNLLQWVTAADSEKVQKPLGFIKRYFPTLVVSVVLFVFGAPIHILVGLIFLINLPFAWFSVKTPKSTYDTLSDDNKEMLKNYAKKMWRYYEELCTDDENYLPPDNFQETPVHRVAHRTSPTNIGYMLLCTLCAKDFGFIDLNTMCTKLEKSLETIEGLEMWNGNLLNWYDTRSKKPLYPRFVSTVDSGNFICSIVTLRQGLKEMEDKNQRISNLIDKLDLIIENCDLSFFYNKRRKLFYIGYDLENQSFSNSYYDLLMSESRMTSFYAIASRQVPKEHWGALSRMLATDSRYAGPISWTGTMFEYYMPNILLPAYENTITYEALRFCSWCQKRRVKGKKKIPWGISESGFYSFDPQLNYQYKAHGVQKLGLKRDLNSDLVISPYSTFLVLPFEPKASIKNIKMFEDMQMTGRCGFYEAVDFTSDRLENKEYAVIRSYMAHHVGMSLLSIENLLMNNIMQKRFIRDNKMAGAVSLLQEKIPSESLVFKDFDIEDPPEIRKNVVSAVKEIEKINPLSPNVKIYSNGEWSLTACDNGASFSRYRAVDIVRTSNDLLKNPMGIFAFVRSKDMTLPITKCLDYDSKANFKATYFDSHMAFESEMNEINCRMEAMVYPHLPCEERKITIKNNSKATFEGELIIYFEPSLSLFKEESQHPAFSKLFLQGDYDEKNNLLIYSRNTRTKKQPLCLATGFIEDFEYDYGMSRENVLKRPYGIGSLINSDISLDKNGIPDLCAAFKIPIKVLPKQKITRSLLLCVSATKEEAIDRVKTAKSKRRLEPENASGSPFKDDMIDGVIASTILPHILFPQTQSKDTEKARNENSCCKRDIWRFGISGDNPIIFVNVEGIDDIEKVAPYVRVIRKIRKCGILVDLAISCKIDESIKDEFGKKMQDMIFRETKRETAGVFLVDENCHDEDFITALKAVAVYIVPKQENILRPAPNYVPFKEYPTSQMEVLRENALNVKGGYFTPGVFTVTEKPKLPWCVVLANSSFGTLLSDKSLGFSWAINSRENKLTPWTNDTMTDNTGEKIYLKINGKVYDLVVGATARLSRKLVQYLGVVEGIKYDITVWIPQKGMIKHCDVRLENEQEVDKQVELVYYTEPVMGVNKTNSRLLKFDFDGKALTMDNRCTMGPFGYMRVGLKGDADFYTCNRSEFLNGKWESNSLVTTDNNCASVGKKIKLPAKRKEMVSFVLSWGASEKASKVVTNLNLNIEDSDNSMLIATPDKELNYMFNTWLPAQIINSRLFGRTGFYQCGGAYGFRDQLQDVSSLVILNPKLVRTHIIRCCAHQFEQGDVLHWWHKLPGKVGGTKGVRTRYSDDLLWLPFVACEYAKKTGDYEIFNIKVPYLEAEELLDTEQEKYIETTQSQNRGTVFEHCTKAIERALKFGEHGLALIGGGDWNDGFNSVGKRGKGESVWLSQFLSMVLTKFARVLNKFGEEEKSKQYLQYAYDLKKSIDEHAWNGDWYLRAFFDDGTPMGVKGCNQCEIDSLSQSFAVLSNMPNEERKNKALESAVKKLVDEENGIIKLFTPSFKIDCKKAGYVNAYPQGIRENSGQYTHAAVWLCNALIKNGQQDLGYKLLRMINPAVKYTDEKMANKYQTEPYALAGDVYSNPQAEGRGGWTLYTGAASWYYRTIYEELLGIKQVDNCLYFEPKLPSNWDGFNMKIVYNGAEISIKAKRQDRVGLVVDGKTAKCVNLDGENHVVLCMFN